MTRYQITRFLKSKILTYVAKILGPRLTANLIARTVRFGNPKGGVPSILCITRPQFSKDLDQMEIHTDIDLVHVKNEFLGHIQKAWLPKEFCCQTKYQYTQTSKNARHWSKAEKFAEHLLNEICKKQKIDGILAAHIDYWQGESLRIAGQRRGIKYFVLCREHAVFPIQQKLATAYYSTFKFKGDAVCVMGRPMQSIMVNSAACRSDQVFVTGAPRFDVWKKVNSRQERSYLTLLSFRAPEYKAPELFEHVLHMFIEQAIQNKADDVTFVVKAKDAMDTSIILSMLKEGIPTNVIVSDQIVMADLLQNSRVSIGFNSLSLVEALIAGSMVAIPNWLDADKVTNDELIFDPKSETSLRATRWLNNEDEFIELIEQASGKQWQQHAIDEDARLATINYVVKFEPSISASQQVYQVIKDQLIPDNQ